METKKKQKKVGKDEGIWNSMGCSMRYGKRRRRKKNDGIREKVGKCRGEEHFEGIGNNKRREEICRENLRQWDGIICVTGEGG